MIPRIIHYCWFGRSPLPKSAQKCIESWKKYFPDYEIREWNEDNFDVNMVPYTAEAYQCKKYAFVSDYARFWILYNYGGIYFDTDVEVIKPMDDIVSKGAFMGVESPVSKANKVLTVAPGLGIGAEKGMELYQQLLSYYDKLHFMDKNGNMIQTTVVEYTTNVLIDKGLKPVNETQLVSGVSIYPAEYFNPTNLSTRRIHVTHNTRSIHHYAGTWREVTWVDKVKIFIMKFLPERWLIYCSSRRNKT